MKIEIDFKDIEKGSPQAGIIEQWLRTIIADKSTDNETPLRYADTLKVL